MSVIKMILTNGFDPDVRVYKEAKYLVNKGHEVDILCWDRRNIYKDKQNENYDGINIIRFEIHSKPGSGFKQLPAYFKFYKECKKHLKQNCYEYLHCHDLDGMLIGFFSKNKTTKLVFDMHELYESGRLGKYAYIIRKMLSIFQNKCYKIIYVNDVQITGVSDKNKDKLIYIPNYPETSKLTDIKKTDCEKLRVSYIGTVRQYEMLKLLMDAVKDDERFFVSINGDGMCYQNIKELSVNYSNVEVTGRYNHDEVIKFYKNADLLYCIYDSQIKNHNTAIATKFFEAIATLTPVIVTEGSQMEQVCKKYGIGISIDSKNIETIKSALLDFYYNRDKLASMSDNMKKIQFNFSWEEIVKNLDVIYN